jgi:uroporphyrinogen decarboxylase
MTRRERVLSALEHRACMPIPYQVDFTGEALKKYIAYTGNPHAAEDVGSCLHGLAYDGWPTEIEGRPGFYKDDFGVVWNRSGVDKDIGVVVDPLIQDIDEDLVRYEFPKPDLGRLRGYLDDLMRTKGDRFVTVGIGFTMFERCWSLMGMENALMAMVCSPEALETLYDRICEYYMPILDVMLEYDVDGVYFGDDWGQQRGLIMGINHWRRFIKPRMAKLYAKAKQAGKFVIQHSCGDCSELFDDLIEIGLDCYQTFQPEIYDIAEMKKKYGDKLTFWGAISTQQVLPRFTPDELRAEIVRIVNILRENGGLIIAPTHALPYDVPPENIAAMVEVFQNQDRYF